MSHLLCINSKFRVLGQLSRSRLIELSKQANKALSFSQNPLFSQKTDEAGAKELQEPKPSQIQKVELPTEDPALPKKYVFQEITKLQAIEPIYTIEQASVYKTADRMFTYYRYPSLANNELDAHYALRSSENEHSLICHFPDRTDLLMVGGGLVGSATAYYAKKTCTRVGDVVVVDKEPYSPHNCTSICNGLISSQSKSRDVTRVAALSKELIRCLRNDILVNEEDFDRINYRPCTHLILWPESELEDVFKAVQTQNDDGCFTETKLPTELEAMFPWLKVCGTEVGLGTHGNQDEALVDPIGLRNLYRTLAQAYGANFVRAEGIDFNTVYHRQASGIIPHSAAVLVARLPVTGELRGVGFASALLSLGHNTPYLEARSEMESYMRDQIEDLHFLQPKLRICFSFNSLMTPVINFPVITDTDGSMLIREDYGGDFSYYLNYDDSAAFLESDYSKFVGIDCDEPYPNLIHKDKSFADYFNNVIKAKLVSRIPLMEDAKFILAKSGFESYNTHDGCPIISLHPFHSTILLSGGYGSRMMNFAPAAGVTFSEFMIFEQEDTFDMTNFYWDRVIKNRKIPEFKNLIR